MLFTSATIGNLTLPNRLVRSATAERMADDEGRPRPQLVEFYRELARGEVGLIITGHMYVHPSGKAHPEMTGIYRDDFIPDLAKLAAAVHQERGQVAAQINHGGMQCSRETVTQTIAPSAIDAPFLQQPAREMTPAEIESLVDAYAQAARRAQEAGFDAVQLHAAHGYLISQFLSPFVNHRSDRWGADGVSDLIENLNRRMNFFKAVYQAVRVQVGPDYPVFAKLGMMDGVEGGLTPAEGVQVVQTLADLGLDAVEISGGIGGPKNTNSQADIRHGKNEAYFRPLAQQARQASQIPLILVGGFRSRQMMEEVLAAGEADFIALCRPLIREPDFPQKLRQGLVEWSACISGNRCWPKGPGEGISCKCASSARSNN